MKISNCFIALILLFTAHAFADLKLYDGKYNCINSANGILGLSVFDSATKTINETTEIGLHYSYSIVDKTSTLSATEKDAGYGLLQLTDADNNVSYIELKKNDGTLSISNVSSSGFSDRKISADVTCSSIN